MIVMIRIVSLEVFADRFIKEWIIIMQIKKDAHVIIFIFDMRDISL